MIKSILEHTDIHVNGVRLHVVQAGAEDGIPVILLHGFPEFWYGWRNQIDALTLAGFRLYIPDQRGYNLSDKPSNVEAYNLDTLAGDIIGLIDHIGVEKARIVGHDWVGAAAWWAANKFPERIQKLAVMNIPHHAALSKAVRENPKQRRKVLYMGFFSLPTLPEILIKARNGALLAHWAFGNNPAFTPDDIQLYKKAWSQPGAVTGMLNWYRAVRQSKPERLASPRITVPVMLIWGKKDQVFLPELAEKSIELCDEGLLEYIDNATHWVQHEAADRVNSLLIDWLRD